MIASVIFDLDDTLCDYQKAKENAKTHMTKYLNDQGIDDCSFWERYQAMEPGLFRSFLNGEIDREEYRLRRFADILSPSIGESGRVSTLTQDLNEIYMAQTNQKIMLFDDVIPVLEKINQMKLRTAILTNGPVDGQMKKYCSTRLDQYISNIYIGEAIGRAKPDPGIFQYALNQIGCAPENALMVGDSLEDDYMGARAVGMNAILINRKQKAVKTAGCISKLNELFLLIESIA